PAAPRLADVVCCARPVHRRVMVPTSLCAAAGGRRRGLASARTRSVLRPEAKVPSRRLVSVSLFRCGDAPARRLVVDAREDRRLFASAVPSELKNRTATPNHHVPNSPTLQIQQRHSGLWGP